MLFLLSFILFFFLFFCCLQFDNFCSSFISSFRHIAIFSFSFHNHHRPSNAVLKVFLYHIISIFFVSCAPREVK